MKNWVDMVFCKKCKYLMRQNKAIGLKEYIALINFSNFNFEITSMKNEKSINWNLFFFNIAS